MPPEPAAVELLPRPDVGRVFESMRTVRLGDVDRAGRLRLDAAARMLQDVATDDANDAGLDRRFGWLVRRTLIEVASPPTLGETIELSTWCTGTGRSWAERRSSMIGDKGGRLDAVSLWVQIDVGSGRPAAIADDFTAAYGGAAAGRRVSARLALDARPPDGHQSGPAAIRDERWVVRRTDLDPFHHVNNAATWAVLEEVAQLDLRDRVGRAELEYVQPINHGDDLRSIAISGDGRTDLWLTRDGVAAAVARWTDGR